VPTTLPFLSMETPRAVSRTGLPAASVNDAGSVSVNVSKRSAWLPSVTPVASSASPWKAAWIGERLSVPTTFPAGSIAASPALTVTGPVDPIAALKLSGKVSATPARRSPSPFSVMGPVRATKPSSATVAAPAPRAPLIVPLASMLRFVPVRVTGGLLDTLGGRV